MYYPPSSVQELPTADALVREMDRTVAGLDTVKRRIAVTLRRHMVAAVLGRDQRPPNLLIMGGSGSGKTYCLQAALRAAPLVWTEVNATEYSDVGYTGRDLVACYKGLAGPQWRGHHGGEERSRPLRDHVAVAERFGVVVIDEWDKWRFSGKRNEREVGRALQAEMLKLAEGSEVMVREGDNDRQGFVLRTRGILHIAVGAFQGIQGVVADRHGWDHDDPRIPDAHAEVQIRDVIAYGFLEELVGRFSTIVAFPRVDAASLTRILEEQLVPVYRHQLEDEGVELDITPGALGILGGRAAESPIGARSLVPELEECLWRAWYDARPGDRIVLDVDQAHRRHADLLEAA